MKKFLALVLASSLAFAPCAFGARITPDSYDKLFTRADNTAVPTTFIDSSTANPKTITYHGNATQLPIKFNKSAGFFNGTTDYVVVPDSADWNFGTGDYDVEFFSFLTSTEQYQTVLERNGNNLNLQFDTRKLTVYQAGSLRITESTAGSLNTWHHYRVQRVSGVTKVYRDNVETGTYTGTDSITSSSAMNIGWLNGVGSFFGGWLKELRISNVARTVAVPTTEYTSDANTVLLMHFDTPATSPLGPAIAFDGTGDSLSVPNGGSFDVADGDFCIDFTYRSIAGTANVAMGIFDSGVDANKGIYIHLAPQASKYIGLYLNGSIVVGNQTITHTAGTATAYRIQRASGTLRFFENGRQIYSVANTTNITANSAVSARIGTRIDGSTSPVNGFIREFRFSNTVRDGNNPYTPSQTGFTVDANTKLYIKGDGDNGVGSDPLSNGSFETWTAGDNVAPDGWTLAGAGAAVAREGTTIKVGTYSAKIVSGSESAFIYNTDFTNFAGLGTTYWKGRTITVGVWVWCAAAVQLVLSDGTQNLSIQNTLASQWEYLTKTMTVSASATSVGISLYAMGAATTAYFDGARITSHSISDSSSSYNFVTRAGDTKTKYTEDYRSCIFKDETGKFPYPVGLAKVDFFAIGSGVGYFDGTNDFLSIPDSDDWDFAAAPFTVECYVRWSTIGTASILYRGAKNWGLEYDTGHLHWYAETSTINDGTWTPTVNTWYHLAVSRGATNSILFVNGTVVDTDADSTDIADTTELRIGVNDSSANDFAGLLDNIRISKGIARYTATFNPPDDYQVPRIGKRKTNWFFFF